MASQGRILRNGARGKGPRLPTTAQAGAVAAIIFVAYAALVLSRWPNPQTAQTVSGLAFPAITPVYVSLAALAARSARGQLRAAWLVMTAGLGSLALGELISAYYRQTRGEVPFPSWADVAYLSYVPLVAVALLLLPTTRSWRDQSRVVLDGLIVMASFFAISWLTVMHTTWHADADNTFQFALALAYPAGEILVLTVAFMVLVRAPAELRLTMALLVAALTCSSVANGVWAYLGNAAEYGVGGVADIFYAANILLIIVALVAAQDAQPGPVAATALPSRIALWLPLLPVAVAAVFVAVAQPDVVEEAPVVIAGVVLVAGTLFRQFLESSELVRREQLIQHLAHRLATEANRVTAELDSAADYVASILPGELTGPVEVHSHYLPSRAVGGDSFGYRWIDDDHLKVHLIDVSGHGVRPALLSVSVHNLLRSGALTTETLLAPDRVLAELNTRFNMDNHDGHYFTMWYGVYQRSTGMLRYANAGHPPPLVLTDENDGTVRCVPLTGGLSLPIGMFADSEFTVEIYVVTPGARILLYSDGVLGDPPEMAAFEAACTELAASAPEFLDPLIARLPLSAEGHIDDDCSLVLLAFPKM